jgi:2-phosphosulfolactate phosphatase
VSAESPWSLSPTALRRAPLNEHGKVFSPEAGAARACFEGTADPASAVTDSASGRELTDGGFADDVAIAIEINSCRVVPVLADHAFTAAS